MTVAEAIVGTPPIPLLRWLWWWIQNSTSADCWFGGKMATENNNYYAWSIELTFSVVGCFFFPLVSTLMSESDSDRMCLTTLIFFSPILPTYLLFFFYKAHTFAVQEVPLRQVYMLKVYEWNPEFKYMFGQSKMKQLSNISSHSTV